MSIARVVRRSLVAALATVLLTNLPNPPSAAATPTAPPRTLPTAYPRAPRTCPTATNGSAEARATAGTCGHAVEILGQRSATGRTFAEPDGTYRLELSAAPRQARAADGTWVPIDTRLRQNPDGTLAPVASSVPVQFSGGGTGPLIVARTATGPLTLTWPWALPAPRLDGDAAVYADVAPGVDLRVRALPTGFTYVLVVRTPAALADPAVRRIPMAVSGPALRSRADGGVEAVGADGTVVLSSGGAQMWDSADGTAPPGTATPGTTTPDTTTPGTTTPDTAAPGIAAAGVMSFANGPGDLAHRAPVAVLTTGHDLVLEPSASALSDPNLVLPVYLDPQIGGRNRWAYANSSNSNNNDGIARVGQDPGGDGTYRSFFEFNLAPVAGTHILAASFDTTLVHSWSCGSTPVDLYVTGGIAAGVNGTRVGWSPGLSTWLDEKSGHAHKPSGGAGCGDDPQPDQPMHLSNLLAGQVQQWASARVGLVTLGLSARSQNGANETATDRWKKFWVPATSLTILYNSIPATPDPSALSTVGTSQTVACYTGAVDGQPRISAANGAQFLATLRDGDAGDVVVARYEWQDVTAGTAVVALPDTAAATTPHTFTVSVPAASLPDGHSIRWRVHGWDRTDSGGASPWCEFAVDNATPGQPVLSSTDLPPFPTSPPDTAVVGRPGAVTARPAPGDTDVVGYYYSVGEIDAAPATYVAARDGTAVIPVVPVVSGLAKNFLTVVAVDAAGNRSPLPVTAADAPGTRQFAARAATPPGVRRDYTGDANADVAGVLDIGNGQTALLNFVSKPDGSTVFDPVVPVVNAPNLFPANRTFTVPGDFNGDGRQDLAVFRDEGGCRTTMWWWLATGNGYVPVNTAIWDSGPGNWCYANGVKVVAGDFSGDGHNDIGAFYSYPNNQVKLWVFLTNADGTGFAGSHPWWDSGVGNWEYSHLRAAAGDVNGDGKDDIVQLYDYNNCSSAVFIYTSTGSTMNWPVRTYKSANGAFCYASAFGVLAADMNGDGLTDLSVLVNTGTTSWNVATFTGPGMTGFTWSESPGPATTSLMKPVTGDFDADGRADLGWFASLGGTRTAFWVVRSNGTGYGRENLVWDSDGMTNGLAWSALTAL